MAHSASSSDLSDPPSSGDEAIAPASVQPKIKLNVSRPKSKSLKQSKLSFGKRRNEPSASPEPRLSDLNREPSPPHEYGMADNPDIAVIVMFQLRFQEAFLKGVPNIGPQDIENGVVTDEPSPQVEDLLCGLLGLVLNRKKNPERGHYGRALEEALASQKYQWPPHWQGINPVPSSKTFASLSAERRIDLLKTLVHWSLTSSEAVAGIIKESYKQSRKEDDLNQPLSVQPWGQDSLKRKFYLVQGDVDTPVRVCREGDRKKAQPEWISVAGNIADVQRVARNLRAENSQAAHQLAKRMTDYIPRLEEREEKRKRKEYRLNRKAAFSRPEPGFSLYEGRTRGKRPRYTYDDDEIYGTDETSNRKSSRQSGMSTPHDGPRYTASGRQVRSAYGTSFGEPSGLRDGFSGSSPDSSGLSSRRDGRPTRSTRNSGRQEMAYDEGYESKDGVEDDEEEEEEAPSSGEEWNGDDEDAGVKDDAESEADADDMQIDSDDSLDVVREPRSLVVALKCGKRLASSTTEPAADAMDVDSKSAAGAMNVDNKPAVAEVKHELANGLDNKSLPLSPPQSSNPPTLDPSPSTARPAPDWAQFKYDQSAAEVKPSTAAPPNATNGAGHQPPSPVKQRPVSPVKHAAQQLSTAATDHTIPPSAAAATTAQVYNM